MKKFKGDLKGFPTEVVDKMLERQVEQGNERDVSVFEGDRHAGNYQGGFNWSETVEGYQFWSAVIINKLFNLFFEKYPENPVEVTKAKLIYAEGKEVIFDLDSTYIEDGMLIIKAK